MASRHPASEWVLQHEGAYTASNPNSLSRPEAFRTGKRCDGPRVEAEIAARNERSYAKAMQGMKPGKRPTEPPQRAQGRQHFDETRVSDFSMMPVSVSGLPWETKRLVRNEAGHPMSQLQSSKADFFGLYGSKRMDQIPNRSNPRLLFSDCTDKSNTIDLSPRSLGMMGEWERKIITTQGRPANMWRREDVFQVDKFRGSSGTGDFVWKKEAIERQRKAAAGSGMSHGRKDARIRELQSEIQRLKAQR